MIELKIKALKKKQKNWGHMNRELYWLVPDELVLENYKISQEELDYIFNKGHLWRNQIDGYHFFNKYEVKRVFANKKLMNRAKEHARKLNELKSRS